MTTTPASEELKPCPFCGGPATTWDWHSPTPKSKAVGCENDDCHFNPFWPAATLKEAAKAWNTRTSPQAESVGDEAHISEFISVNKDGGRAFDLKAFAGTPQGREKLMRLITQPKSAKDGERQAALDACDTLKYLFIDDEFVELLDTIEAALTAKPENEVSND